MKVLITGSAGLIGTALTKKFLSLGVEVIEFDSVYDPTCPRHGNILNDKHLSHCMEGVNGVIHLAAVSRVLFGERQPELCWKTNVEGTKNVLQAALESQKSPWFLYASSREVYGEQKQLNVNESASLAPVNVYGQSKAAAEEAVKTAVKQGLKASIMRFSNVFGSIHDHRDRVVPAFCLAAANGTSIRVDGRKNLFDFTFLNDVVYGVLAMVMYICTKRIAPPPIHFTTGRATSLEEIALFAQKNSVHPVEIIDAPSRSFDVSSFSGDPKRAETLLGWKGATSVEEGMRQLINEFRLSSMIKLHA